MPAASNTSRWAAVDIFKENYVIGRSNRLMRAFLRIALVVSIPVVGVWIGYWVGSQLSGAAHLPSSPQQIPWRSIGSPGDKPVAILAGDRSSVATVSSTGSISYWRSDSGWQEVDQMPYFSRSEHYDSLSHDPPPGDVIAIYKTLEREEAGVFTEFALLMDGTVWIWQYQQPGLGLLVAFVYGVAGSCIGLLIGLSLAWWAWRKLPPALPE